MVGRCAMIQVTEIKSPEVAQMAVEARQFLDSHRWCGEITAGRLGFAIAGVIGLFQFDFEATKPEIDNCLWVVVGDLPPAYLVCDDNPTWQDALRGYIREMRRWVGAVRRGEDLAKVIPVNTSPTDRHAKMLEKRLDFLEVNLASVDPVSLEGEI
jgi:hypothetical protein